MKHSKTILAVAMILTAGVAGAFAADAVSESRSEPVAFVPASWHPELQEGEYVGSRDGCRKCHLREYRSWERTPHAKAIELLSPEEQADPNCVKCHSTGFGEPTGFVSMEETPKLANVGCEVCHGPGSLFMDKEIMKDHDAAIAAGLRVPDETTCRACHNAESPTFSGEFDFEVAKEEGIHDIR